MESKGVAIPRGYPPGTIAYAQRPSLRKVIAGLPEFVFGATLAAAWLSPGGFTGATSGLAFQAMAVEFLLVHANTLFGWRAMSLDRRGQWRMLFFFSAVYVAFGGGLSLAFKSPGALLIVVAFTTTRTWAALTDPPPTEFAQRYWYNVTGLNIGLYFLLSLVTAFVPLPFSGGISEPMLWFDGWDWEVERLVFMASAFYLLRGFAIMWPWPRTLYLLPAPDEMRKAAE